MKRKRLIRRKLKSSRNRRLQQMDKLTTTSMVSTLVVKWERDLRPIMISLKSRIWLKKIRILQKMA